MPLLLGLLAMAGAVEIYNNSLWVDGSVYHVKGVAYSPVPIGESVFSPPFGDYSSPQYSAIWNRDFPSIREAGFNTLRVYAWREDVDHSEFLETAAQYGLKVLITWYLGTATQTRVSTATQRQRVVDRFVSQVEKYSRYSAVLGWTFGNEVNGEWNGFLTSLSDSYDCDWSTRCWYVVSENCNPSRHCVYNALFGWINDAHRQAQRAMGEHRALLVTSFADVDFIDSMVVEYAGNFTHIDAWGFQVYRGKDFGDILDTLPDSTGKPILITEYGVDAYNDECGHSDSSPCYNTYQTTGVDQTTHADWNGNLTQELITHYDNGTIGGFLMAWTDEYWKNSIAVKGCTPRLGEQGFSPATCDWRGHVDCPSRDISVNGICGYSLESTFDGYVNEGWYGINSVSRGSTGVDKLHHRQLYYRIQSLYGGVSEIIPWYTRTWVIVAAVLVLIGLSPVVVHELGLFQSPISAILGE